MKLSTQIKEAIEEFQTYFYMNEQDITAIEYYMDYDLLEQYQDEE